MEKKEKSLAMRVGSLVAATAAVWLLVFVLCPLLTNAVPEMRRMAAFVDESGIETGEFYYTDVEIVGHAELGARSTFEITPTGRAERAENAVQAGQGG